MSFAQRISNTNLFRKVFYFFPVQLIFVHLKNNPILMTIWAIIVGINSSLISEKYGVPFLFLSPEYMGEVSFISYGIIGFSFGGFIMAFNISSYVTNGHRFPFIATLSKPFLKYCLNNIFWTGSLLLIYIINTSDFLINEEGCSLGQTIIFLSSFLVGVFIMIFLNGLYFIGTNKDLEKLSGGKYQTVKKPKAVTINAVLHKKVAWENFFNADREWRVETYLSNPLRVGIARSIDHYDQSMLKQVFEQNHLNAALFEIIVFISLIGLSFGSSIPYFTIPAGASLALLLTMFVMITSAIHSWFRGWAPAVMIILFLCFNFASKYEFFSPHSKAFGLNYETKPAQVNKELLNQNSNPENCKKDIQHTLSILEKWKKKNQVNDQLPKMIFINTTGGGMRSALWSFYAMQQCDSILNGRLLEQTQLISGSSGGLIGLSYLRELMLRKKRGEIKNLYAKYFAEDMAKDILNKIAFTLTVNDVIFKFQTFEDNGFQYKIDRGYAFEEQLNENTHGYMNRRLYEYYKPEAEAEIPMLIVNPTIINNGKRMIISPQPTSYMTYIAPNKNISNDYLQENIEFKRVFKDQGADDLKFTTALRMSSTFPYVMPLVYLPSEPELKVMDAGLSDNYGVKNSIKFLYTFKDWIKENTSGIIFIQIRDSEKQPETEIAPTKSFVKNFSAPVQSVYKNLFLMQDYDHDQLIQFAGEWFDNKIDVIDMVLENTEEKQLSLSWHLTESEKKITYNSINRTDNQHAIQKLRRLLK
ncbi:MAG: hypothetical protein CMP61_05720 [Flavobacteriales bacterium]|mgnify:CR=1 FL=1|nr:hypothetical protein [Flavobacteriales bacterium]